MPSADIFISYNREDATKARLFADAFAAAGLTVWWDTALRAGEAYDVVTETALRKAKAVAVLWSTRSVASRWVRAEATLAERNNTLLPCMIEPCERPIMFELVQTAELSHWQGDPTDKAWQDYLAEVQRYVARGSARAPNSSADAGAGTPGEIAESPPPAQDKLLAVLPFDNLSSDAEMVYFSDGISEDILGRVSRGSDLKVVGRAMSFNYRGVDKSKAAAALHATHVLDGSIRRAGNKVRIFAHLTEAKGLTTLWSDHYDRDLDDIFAVQDEISEAIANALDAAFSPTQVPSIDPAAYDLFLQVRAEIYHSHDIAKYDSMSARLVEMAPNFAQGWGLRANIKSWVSKMVPFAERPPIQKQAHEAIEHCLSLDPDSPTVTGAQWNLMNPFGQFLEQEEIAQTMLRHWREQGHAEFQLPYHLECVGRARESIALLREFRATNALPIDHYLGMVLWRAGEFAEGRALLEQALITGPEDPYLRAAMISVYLKDDDFAGLDRLLDPAVLEKYPLYEFSWLVEVVDALKDGTPERRDAIFDSIWARHASAGAIEPFLITLWSDMGLTDKAYEIAEQVRFGPSGTDSDVMGPIAYKTISLFSAAYPQFREDRRFVKLCARLGLVEYWLETGCWPDCADEVSYDFRAECESYRNFPKDQFLPDHLAASLAN